MAMESARIRAAMIGEALSPPSPQDPIPTSNSVTTSTWVTTSTSDVAISTTAPKNRPAWVGKPERDRKEKERRERALELAAQWAEEEIEREHERALEEEAERIRLVMGRYHVKLSMNVNWGKLDSVTTQGPRWDKEGHLTSGPYMLMMTGR
ncbi:hypothetical protein LTR16_009751, partial [Cryomyces antarcticus]